MVGLTPETMKKSAFLLAFLLLTGFNIFYKLDGPSVRMWDESRSGINAMEMLETGDLIVMRFDGEPDLWYTKPPLVAWMQAGFMSVLGRTELALRLPSALAALFTCLLLLWFSVTRLGRWRPGFMAGLALVGMKGYIAHHVARTGDSDSVLIFFVTAYGLFFFNALEAERRRKLKWLMLSALALGAAAMAKSSAALLMLPGVFIYTMIQPRPALFQKLLMLTVLTAGAGILAAYYLIREIAEPGFLSLLWNLEWGGRYMGGFPHHHEPWDFFIHALFRIDLFPHLWWVPLILFILFMVRKEVMGRAGLYGLLMAAIYLVIISVPATKLEWYDAQMCPFIALSIGCALHVLIGYVEKTVPDASTRTVATVMVIALLGPNYYLIYRQNNSCADPKKPEYERAGYAAMELLRQRPLMNDYSLLGLGFNQSAHFYKNRLEAEHGVRLHNLDAFHHTPDPDLPLLICHDTLNQVFGSGSRPLLWATDYGCRLYGPEPNARWPVALPSSPQKEQ